jgi:signal transduction histidine kinase
VGRSTWQLDVIFAVTLGLLGIGILLAVANRGATGGIDPFAVVGGAGLAATSTIGWIILRRTGNPIGWIFAAFGLGMAITVALNEVLVASASRAEPLPMIGGVANVYNLGGLLMTIPLAVLFLLFPTGAPSSPRWRWVLRAWVIGGAILLVWGLFRPGELWGDPRFPGGGVANPIGLEAFRVLLVLGGTIVFAVAVAGIVSLGLRYRRAVGEERQQIRWVVVVAAAGLAVLLIGFAQNLIGAALGVDEANPPAWFQIVSDAGWFVLTMLILFGLPAAVAVGVLKYRLYEIDVVIRKTVIVAVVAVAVIGVYLLVLALALSGVGSRLVLGAVILLLTFRPVLRTARSIADRAAYGKRATSYEVLTEFTSRVGETYAAEDVLPRMVQILAEGTGAEAARILVRVGTETRDAATVGTPGPNEVLVPVLDAGEELGALAVTMPASDPMNPAKQRLVDDLAHQAGLVLRNVRLIEELKASRQRLVAAQDEERRKLERNLHDGAQQQLVALAVKQRLLGNLIGSDDEKARAMVAQLADDTSDALENLRDLARGIYPPLLADKGLVAALEAQARKAAVPTTVEGNGVGRFGQDVEAAVYFSCLEALQNVAKYAEASRATIALANGDRTLRFTVTDDGRGFDSSSTSYGTGLQGISDRLAALSGTVEVRSEPGQGTTVTGTVPA